MARGAAWKFYNDYNCTTVPGLKSRDAVLIGPVQV